VATAFDTRLGWMAVAKRDELLVGVVFGHASRPQAAAALRRLLTSADVASVIDFVDVDQQPESLRAVVALLERYAEGEDVDFGDVALDQRHLTPFGCRIVEACRRIPAGQTRSYGELATKCGSPGASRAVGQVMAKNRFPLVVPCHRVLAAGGLLGGFSAPQGLAMKRRLLELESQLQAAR
jgi:methylated-DNA-[protein]-cysteine S-methyltransferase